MEKEKKRAPAAAAAIQIVEAMAQRNDSVTLSDLSRDTGLNKNMISRILTELVDADWVVFHPDAGNYSLSLQLFRLGSTALEKQSLQQCAGPYLRYLNDLTGDCIQLAVLHKGRAVYIAQMESKKEVGIRGKVGDDYSIDTTAPGKALKAFALKDPDMEETRQRGYAVDNEEFGRGIICLAAPIFDYTGEAIASVGISTLTMNYTLEELEAKYASVLLEKANALSRELGYGD